MREHQIWAGASSDESRVDTMGEASAHWRFHENPHSGYSPAKEIMGDFSDESLDAISVVMFPKSRVTVSIPKLWKNRNMNYLHMRGGANSNYIGRVWGLGRGLLHKELEGTISEEERKIKSRAIKIRKHV